VGDQTNTAKASATEEVPSMTVQTILRDGAEKVAGARPVRRCEGCGEEAGSVSAGTGRPLVRDRESGLFFYVSCKPGAVGIDALASLSGLGA
jgi:hypothetical protein